jgi:hypothetical protein
MSAISRSDRVLEQWKADAAAFVTAAKTSNSVEGHRQRRHIKHCHPQLLMHLGEQTQRQACFDPHAPTCAHTLTRNALNWSALVHTPGLRPCAVT